MRPPDRLQRAAMDRAEATSFARWSLRRRIVVLVPLAIVGSLGLAALAWLLGSQGGDPTGARIVYGGTEAVWLTMIILNIVAPRSTVRFGTRTMTVREEDLGRQSGFGTPDISSWPPRKEDGR